MGGESLPSGILLSNCCTNVISIFTIILICSFFVVSGSGMYRYLYLRAYRILVSLNGESHFQF